MVVSPGIPAAATPIIAAQAAGVTVLSELAFASQWVQAKGIPIIAVTGTNGKSSVTWFIGQLLEAAGHSASWRKPRHGTQRAGDERRAPRLRRCRGEQLPARASGGFAPTSAAVLNLAPDHLGRHGT